MRVRVVLATRALSGVLGGLERQLREISSALCNFDFEIHLIYLSDSDQETFFKLDDRIIQHKISGRSPDKKTNWLGRLQRQREVFSLLKEIRPNIAITFMTGSYYFVCLPALLLCIPLILAERNSPQIYEVTSAAKNRRWIFLSMIFATRITTQFTSYIQKYPIYLQKKFISIPNAIPAEIESLLPRIKPLREPVVYLFAGRFSFQKRVELLIESFAEFSQDKNDVILNIFGSGQSEDQLRKRIRELRADSRIFVHSASKDLSSEILKADALCIPSLWEGFPNVLLESLYLGVPGLGFSNCDGVKDLLTDGENGWLAEFGSDGSSYTALLERSYVDIKNFAISKEACRDSVKNYVPKKVYGNWKKLIEDYRSKPMAQ
jgi:glycosyltransferase involved in cell wall biosynthesis